MKTQNRQRGLALLVLVFFLALVALGLVARSLNSETIKNERDRQTATALAEARMALIGWSVARGASSGTARPGEMPCPDNDAPGAAGYGSEDATCVAGKVGRLPWRTLGISEIRDGYGEPLWYALDGAFRKRSSNNSPINSDTRASMLVYAADGLTKMTSDGNEAVAVIFSAGSPVNGESRTETSSLCPATGTTILENRCASNYLEMAGGRNNATNGGPFILGNKTNTFNDQLMYVTASELMTAVERRVGKEAVTLLENYKNTYGYYPNPAQYNAAGCLDVGSSGYTTDCQSNPAVCRGRFPDNASNGLTPPNDTANWAGSNALPLWFSYNLWGQVIYYSVGDGSLKSPAGCATQLTLDTVNVNGLILLPNSPLGTVARNSPTQSLGLNRYFEDYENQDGWFAMTNDLYTSPTAGVKDRVFALP